MISKGDLIREYGAMQERINRDVSELREEKKKWLREQSERVRREHKTAFAVRLNQARDEGMKRDDLLDVLNTKRGDVLKDYVEMGGGSMRKIRTAEERVAEIQAVSEAEKTELLERLGIIEEFTCDRGFPAFRLEEDFWGYVDQGVFFPGYGDDFNSSKWHHFRQNGGQEIGDEIVKYVQSKDQA